MPTVEVPPIRSLRQDGQVIALIGLAHGTSHFFHLILAPLFPWLKADFILSYGQLGLLMTVFFLVSGIGQALAGFVVDRVGAYPVHLIGLSLLALSALGLAFSRNYAMLLFFEGAAGLGNCVFHPSGFTILNRRVSVKRLGHAFGVHGLSGTLGWGVAPVFLAGLATLFNWRIALFAASGLAFIVLALLAAYRDVLDTPRQAANAVPSSEPYKIEGGRLAYLGILGILGLRGVWMCFSFFLITAMSSGGIQSFAPSALHDIYGVPIPLAMVCITAYMLANAGGMIVGGFLAAHTTRHEKVIALGFGIAGLLSVVVASGIVPGVMTLPLLAVIGFGAGIAGPSRDLMVRAAAPPHATGRVYGVVYSGLDVGLAVSPLLFGRLMDAHHPGWVFIMIGAFQSMALLTAIGIGSGNKRLATAEEECS
jgi:MFS transporter, FSR family, fosmidomycin resistance protein